MGQPKSLFDGELPDGEDGDVGNDINFEDMLPQVPGGGVSTLQGQRAEWSLCRLCVTGAVAIMTLDNDDPQYKVVREHCRLGLKAPEDGEVQLCSAYWPRTLSIVAVLEARAVRQKARKMGERENIEAIRSFPGGRSPIPKPALLKKLIGLFRGDENG